MTKKLLVESIKYITGKTESVSITSSPAKVRAYREVLSATKSLYEALGQREANLKIVSKLISKKKEAAKNYQKVVGETWPM